MEIQRPTCIPRKGSMQGFAIAGLTYFSRLPPVGRLRTYARHLTAVFAIYYSRDSEGSLASPDCLSPCGGCGRRWW